MRLVRSWPLHPPQDRNCVIDDAERLVNDNYDYRGLAEFGDDLIHIDWDTAVSREDVETFAKRARQHPNRVLVAPVPVYPDSRKGLPDTVWNLRRYEANFTRYLRTGEEFCHLFGFGMLYLPQALIRGFLDAFAAELADGRMRFDDTAFAQWHYLNIQAETLVTWEIRPVHLHYRISEVVI